MKEKKPKLSIHNMYLKSRQFNYLHILCKNKIHLNASLSYAASELYEFIFVGISKHTSVTYFFFYKIRQVVMQMNLLWKVYISS